MIDENFKNWLLKEKELANKSANDVLSRCRRVELVLHLSINNRVRNSENAENLVAEMKKQQSKFFGSKINTVSAFPVIVRAVRLYGEYRQSK